MHENKMSADLVTEGMCVLVEEGGRGRGEEKEVCVYKFLLQEHSGGKLCTLLLFSLKNNQFPKINSIKMKSNPCFTQTVTYANISAIFCPNVLG